jgi:cytosine deaminase
MVITLAPCWYCSGLVRQFRIGTLIVGERGLSPVESTGCAKWRGGHRPRQPRLPDLLEGFIAENPEVWNEDIGEE